MGPAPRLPSRRQKEARREGGKSRAAQARLAAQDEPEPDGCWETALQLLALPREAAPHPETGEIILAGTGRFCLYPNAAANINCCGR